MTERFSRKDTSLLGKWWWTVDRWSLSVIFVLIIAGIFLSFAGSPPVADRLNLGGFFFVKRHLLLVFPAIFLLLSVSILTPRQVRRLATVFYLIGIPLLCLTLFSGIEIKGAKRWLNLWGFSLQISEFIKPAFSVLVAWMLAEKYVNPEFPGLSINLVLLSLFLGLLLCQPDLGMSVIVLCTWIAQLFIAGLPLLWLGVLGALGLISLATTYFLFPHVGKRIDQFFNPALGDIKGDLYQVHQSLEAFANGRFFGKGPGEGVIKKHLPDAHSDFIFSVAGEEFGFLLCIVLVALFVFIIIRSFLRALKEESLFIMLAITGLVVQFGLQAFVNMASSLRLIPTKGMTLPFISYGGSSLLALAIAMGMLLSLTRKRHGSTDDL